MAQLSETDGGTVAGGNTADDPLKELKSSKEKLLLEKEIATAQSEIAKAQKDTIDSNQAMLQAQLPSGQNKPLEGTITTDTDFGFIAELAAYNAVKQMTAKLAGEIKTAVPKEAKVLIIDDLDFSSIDIQLLQMKNQLELYLDEFKNRMDDCSKLIPKTTTGPSLWVVGLGNPSVLPAVSGIVSAAADIVGYLQTNYEVKSRKVTLSNTALHAAVAGAMKKNGLSVYLPTLHRIKDSDILNLLKQCIMARQTLGRLAAFVKGIAANKKQVEQKSLQDEIAAQETELKGLTSPADDARIRQINKDIAEKKGRLENMPSSLEEQIPVIAETLIQSFDAFNTAIVTVPQGKTNPPLFEVAVRQYADQIGITHILYLTSLSTGGEAILQKKLFGMSGNIAYLGGGAIACMLVDQDGAILYSNQETALSRVNYNLGQKAPPKFD